MTNGAGGADEAASTAPQLQPGGETYLLPAAATVLVTYASGFLFYFQILEPCIQPKLSNECKQVCR